MRYFCKTSHFVAKRHICPNRFDEFCCISICGIMQNIFWTAWHSFCPSPFKRCHFQTNLVRLEKARRPAFLNNYLLLRSLPTNSEDPTHLCQWATLSFVLVYSLITLLLCVYEVRSFSLECKLRQSVDLKNYWGWTEPLIHPLYSS